MEDFNEAELLAEHQAQKAAAEVAAKAKEEAEREERHQRFLAQQATQRAARVAREGKHVELIAAKVRAQGHTTVVDGIKLEVDGIDVSYHMDIQDERRHLSSWRSEPNGKLRITVGSYGHKTQFPQRKDGTFNYDSIARILVDYAVAKKIHNRLDAQRQTNADVAKALAAELIPNAQYQDVITASADEAKPVSFNFKLSQAMSVEDARKLAAAIRGCGIKLHYSDK